MLRDTDPLVLGTRAAHFVMLAISEVEKIAAQAGEPDIQDAKAALSDLESALAALRSLNCRQVGIEGA